MAKLYENSGSDEEFPELSTILRRPRQSSPSTTGKGRGKERERRIIAGDGEFRQSQSIQEYAKNLPEIITKVTCNEKPTSKQRPLKLAHVNSLLLSVNRAEKQKKTTGAKPDRAGYSPRLRPTPKRVIKSSIDEDDSTSTLHGLSMPKGRESIDDLSDFVLEDSTDDSDDDDEITSLRVHVKKPEELNLICSPSRGATIDLTSPKRPTSVLRSRKPGRRNDSQVPENYVEGEPGAQLKFSPPRSTTSHIGTDRNRPATPPLSPSKAKLQSPSKRHRIPPSPHRPSIDAFWSQEVINDWNDQYSPQKTLKHDFPRTLCSVNENGGSENLSSASPLKSSAQSPKKQNNEELQRRRLFNERKHDLATSFLKELDEKITNGKIMTLALSAGGVHVVWSKKLNSTAGRANWKREAIRSKSSNDTVVSTTYHHHATIELAEKVIDDEDRLFNVIAHEYCHLANFMISGIKNNPHGKEFKEWASKVSAAFSHLGIHVTTKHTYDITYKYIWACTSAHCGLEFKRHSKSIDPTRHSCGRCKSTLVQIKPVPRIGKSATMADGARKDRFQDYVKENFGRIREENPGLGMGGWMGILGQGFREERERGEKKMQQRQDMAFDDVARKLDFLTLAG